MIRIHVQGRNTVPAYSQKDSKWLLVTCSNPTCFIEHLILRRFDYEEMRHYCDQYELKIQVSDLKDALNVAAAALIEQATLN